MPLLEFHRIGKPPQRIAERTGRDLNEYLLACSRIVVGEHKLPLLADLQAEPSEITLAAGHPSGFQLGLEQDVGRVEIAYANLPRILALGQQNPTALVKIEAYAFGAFLGRDPGRVGI